MPCMTTIVTESLSVDDLALRESLSGLPGVEVEIEQIVESGEETAMPLLCVHGVDLTRLTSVCQ